VAAVLVGFITAFASAAPKPNNPTITFVDPSPSATPPLTTSSVSFAFAYNRKPGATVELVCTLEGPTPFTERDCTDPTALGSGSQSVNNDYSGLANGPYTFTVSLTLSDGGTASASRSFTVGVNQLPVANNDSFTVNEDGSLNVAAPGVLGNDTDDSGPLTAVLVSDAANGTLTLNQDGSFTYTPAANYNGPDEFIYSATDGSLASSPAQVSITVVSVNDPPVANDVSASTMEDESVTITLSASDIDSGPLTVAVTDPEHGTLLTVIPISSFVWQVAYIPDANFSGPDSFTYKVTDDGGADSNAAAVSITVTPVDD
jgi:VCBS repeat-containing protein